MVYLLSDLSSAVHGQVVRMKRDALALMTHPAVPMPAVERAERTAAQVARAFDKRLAARQKPLGVADIV